MKLHYYKVKQKFPNNSNFGDNLNLWLWDKLLPGILDNDGKTIFVGIGTLLNEQIPKASRTVVFSSGVGYGQSIPSIDESWKIYCLRGPLSAKALGVSPELAITDGALLIRKLFQPTGTKLHKFSFMPHLESANYGNIAWQLVSKQLGFGYIDPRWSIEQVLSGISQTEILLTEAMHGAIVADALRIPWIPISTNPNILSFKWQDWCLSIGVEYHPQKIGNLSVPWYQGWKVNKQQTKNLKQDGIALSDITETWNMRKRFRQWIKGRRVAVQLDEIANNCSPILSDDKHLDKLTFKLEDKLQQFQSDVESGYFDCW
jgi:succinoglycan biosynthesis protein ExoV